MQSEQVIESLTLHPGQHITAAPSEGQPAVCADITATLAPAGPLGAVYRAHMHGAVDSCIVKLGPMSRGVAYAELSQVALTKPSRESASSHSLHRPDRSPHVSLIIVKHAAAVLRLRL